jgi:hypothetical protein
LPYYYNAMPGYHGQYDFWNDNEVKVIHYERVATDLLIGKKLPGSTPNPRVGAL